MISVVTFGRNDNYGFNLAKRTALGFNCLAEVLTEEDEILFVDYNTPDHLPTLPEFLWDTLTEKALNLIKVVRISCEVHKRLKKDSPLPILENVCRNAAIVRSNPQNRWILSTNPDIVLVLSSNWQNFTELLKELPDSFYEMPRFDIPESVWNSLHRDQPKVNMGVLRDWLVSHKAAVAETVPEWRFQKYLLFDAPGDFQLAPRHYFCLLRGFDESMNKYLHSDSNLAKRMWLFNKGRTDHLLGKLWVLHQDHYLSGEWAKNFGTIVHNDLFQKVLNQEDVEANGRDWGLQSEDLPIFALREKITQQRTGLEHGLPTLNGDLELSREIDWSTHSVYRLSHYDPEMLMLYLRENLRVARPESSVAYLGQNPATLEHVRRVWKDVSPTGALVCDLSEAAERAESITPDILLVDFYYNRPEYWERRIRLVEENIIRRLEKNLITESKAHEYVSEFTERTDSREWARQMASAWGKAIPHLRLQPGASILLLGCSQYSSVYTQFKEAFAKSYVGAPSNGGTPQKPALYQRFRMRSRAPLAPTSHENLMGPAYFKRKNAKEYNGPMDLQTLYVHHRLVVLRVN